MIPLEDDAGLRALQRYVHDLEAQHGWLDADLVRNCFLMGEEVGELFRAVRDLETTDDREAAVAHVGEEIVDVLNYLLAIANRVDLDLDEAFRAKNRRNEQRRW